MREIDSFEKLPLAGYPIVSTTSGALSTALQERQSASTKTVLLFANTNLVLTCKRIRSWFRSDEIILVNDGIGLDIAALLTHGRCYRDNLNGTDFLPYYLKDCRAGRKIFLFGGKPGVAEKAASVIEREYGHQVVGYLDGYSRIPPIAIRDVMNRSGAEIILVAMGNPLQEEWIRANMDLLNATLFVGVGALFDFLTGGVQRAPLWVRRIRFEWLFRLSQEPKRLLKRYTLDIFSFLVLCLRYRSQMRAMADPPTQ
jgi:beta-1,4-glucosyltransferase